MTLPLGLLQQERVVDLVVRRASPAQRELWRERDARYSLFRGGRGSGKTHAGKIWVTSRPPGSTVMCAAPTYKSLKTGILAQLLPFLRSTGLLKSYHVQDGEIRTVDGKLIYLRSLDKYDAAARGPNLSHLWVDEGRDITLEAWLALIASLRKPRFRCQAIVTTTPKKNWLWEFFELKKDRADRKQIVSRSEDNPALEQAFFDSLRDEFDGAYAAQELDGSWIDLAGVEVYNPDRLQFVPLPPDNLLRTCRAWDTASTGGGGDYTAGVLLSFAPDYRLYIRDIVRGQWEPHERDAVIKQTAESDDLACGPTSISLPKERGGSGNSQADYWTRQLVGHRVSTHLESGDKVVRAGPAASAINGGNVVVTSEPGRWQNYWHKGRRLTPAEAQRQFGLNLGAFPAIRTKDESDALAAALEIVRKRGGLGIY